MLVGIGYEGRDIDGFVATLRDAEVELLVDVRGTPRSRKPGFSKTKLSETLADAGIGYEHVRELGVPREQREAFRRGDEDVVDRYKQRLDSDARAAVERVVELGRDATVAVLCFEREQTTCHRRLVLAAAEGLAPDIEVSSLD